MHLRESRGRFCSLKPPSGYRTKPGLCSHRGSRFQIHPHTPIGAVPPSEARFFGPASPDAGLPPPALRPMRAAPSAEKRGIVGQYRRVHRKALRHAVNLLRSKTLGSLSTPPEWPKTVSNNTRVSRSNLLPHNKLRAK